MPTSLVDLLVTCDRVLVGEELGGQRRWRKLNIELNNLQTRHNFVGGIRIFSVKICINPYPSSMHRCITTLFTRFVTRCSLQKKSRHCVMKIDSQRQRRGATVADIDQSRPTGDEISRFSEILAEKASCVTCVDDKTVVLRHILNNLFFSNLPQIRITT